MTSQYKKPDLSLIPGSLERSIYQTGILTLGRRHTMRSDDRGPARWSGVRTASSPETRVDAAVADIDHALPGRKALYLRPAGISYSLKNVLSTQLRAFRPRFSLSFPTTLSSKGDRHSEIPNHQQRLVHIGTADCSSEPFVAYAAARDIKVKDQYHWKIIKGRRTAMAAKSANAAVRLKLALFGHISHPFTDPVVGNNHRKISDHFLF